MFYVSKILWGLFKPACFLFALAIAAVLLSVMGKNRAAFGAAAAVFALILIFGFSPFGDWLIGSLEDRASAIAAANLDGASGIIVLGGGLEDPVSPHGPLELDLYGGRLAEAAKLARRYPDLPVILSGGSGDLFPRQGRLTEAEEGRRFLERYGLSSRRIVLEGRSRNTFENAALSAELLKPGPPQKWILVTSAFHMPRAKALFEGQGFRVLPYPVDYRKNQPRPRRAILTKVVENFSSIDLAAKEWAGIAVYWLRGDLACCRNFFSAANAEAALRHNF